MAKVVEFYNKHPKLVAWAVLAVGMVIMLLWSAKDVGLLPTQTIALVIATIGLAGLCVWIIGWEDSDEEESQPSEAAADKK
jgi:MFS superfamily sulfate permease-like transporter